MVSPAVACLPAAVSLLLLAALFMQISGVSLVLTWPCRLCLLRVLLCTMPLLQAFPFQSTLGEVTLHPLSQACVFIYSSLGRWVFPPLPWIFPPTAAFTSFSTPDCWACTAAPASQACLFTAHVGSGSFPLSCGVSSLCHCHKLSHSWLLGTCCRSRPLRPGPPSLFTVL
jgi:hypothetical protein